MNYMNKFYKALGVLNEGIVIIDKQLKVCYWNNYMETITNLTFDQVNNKSILSVLPKLNTNYFKKTVNDLFESGNKAFFSAAMHKDLLNESIDYNLNLSVIDEGESKYLLLEFIDVSCQFMQINKLKSYITELHKLNTKLKEKEKIIEKLAYYDSLTGVANRTLFYELAKKMLHNAKRNNHLMCLMFLDVDNFKCINDQYGHEIGDRALIKVAEILNNAVRKNDIVARYGGDEFLILLPKIQSYDDFKVIESRISESKDILSIDGNEIEISISVGKSFYPKDGDTIDKLITKADKDMYRNKRKKFAGLLH